MLRFQKLDFLNRPCPFRLDCGFWLFETHGMFFLKASAIKKCLLPRLACESNGNKVWDLPSVTTTPTNIVTIVLRERVVLTAFGCQRHICPFFWKLWKFSHPCLSESPGVWDWDLQPTLRLSLFALEGVRQGPV